MTESILIPTHSINFNDTFASGQTFAFTFDGGSFWGVSDGKPVRVGCFPNYNAENMIYCRRKDEAYWRKYFDLDRDYAELLQPYTAADPVIASCTDAYSGIRVLRQPVWETLCAFIISANNHQRRIESIYRNIAMRWGEQIHWEGRTLYGFPSPQILAIAGESALREAGAGYRAPYLAATAEKVADGFPLDMDSMDYKAALTSLMKLPGVGEKVADCVLLFSSRHSCAFPVDVWMERVLRAHYGFEGSRSAIKKKAQAKFGAHAGILQQYLFHGARSGVI
ncbi:MAG: hypothetical protein LBH09_03845 [Peptococcaceae bacterium]|nr:hypothetical protein [Peptococcaceae bacterium]